MMDTLQLLISQDEIEQKILQTARIIDAQYGGEELTIVMVMKGAICVAADLMRALKTPCTVEYVNASSYGKLGSKRGELKISGLEDCDLAGRNLLLVDDIFDSGHTLTRIMSELAQKNPKSIKTLVLLTKKVHRDTNYIPDYSLFEIENLFVVGCGLDYKEHYRALPGIYAFTVEPK